MRGLNTELLVITPLSGNCEDSYLTECKNWKEKNFCSHRNTRGAMKVYCPKTCSLCEGCKDKNSNCDKWAEMGVRPCFKCYLGIVVEFGDEDASKGTCSLLNIIS